MLKRKRFVVAPMVAVGLAGLALAACSTYGAGDYGYYGRSYPSYGYGSPYSYGRGSIYVTPRAHDRGYYSGYGHFGRRETGHNGFAHLGGRRH